MFPRRQDPRLASPTDRPPGPKCSHGLYQRSVVINYCNKSLGDVDASFVINCFTFVQFSRLLVVTECVVNVDGQRVC